MFAVKEIMIETAESLREDSFHFGYVDPLDSHEARELVEAREGFAGAGEEDKAADRLIEPVDRVKKDVARLAVLFFHPRLGISFERVAAYFIGLREQARRLVGNKQMIIAKDDFRFFV
jgi:hypothetical protein